MRAPLLLTHGASGDTSQANTLAYSGDGKELGYWDSEGASHRRGSADRHVLSTALDLLNVAEVLVEPLGERLLGKTSANPEFCHPAAEVLQFAVTRQALGRHACLGRSRNVIKPRYLDIVVVAESPASRRLLRETTMRRNQPTRSVVDVLIVIADAGDLLTSSTVAQQQTLRMGMYAKACEASVAKACGSLGTTYYHSIDAG